MISEPRFWGRPPGLAAAALAPASVIYGAVAAARLRRPGQSCGIPVICIGNLTLGGAGKTPTALAVVEFLMSTGARPFFLSRGYGGRLAGPLLVDPMRHDAAAAGDEPLLLARMAPTVVARDRVAGALLARDRGATVVVMDDGFQNPSLAKDLSILVVDAGRGIGNGRIFPAGPLRAPLAAQLSRAQALVVIGNGSAAAALAAPARIGKIPVFAATLEPDPDDVAALAGKAALAFAGIGDPEKFFATLRRAGVDLRQTRVWPDHHLYTAADAAALLAQARAAGLALVTTEKDMARLIRRDDTAELAKCARTVAVSLEPDDRTSFFELVKTAISGGADQAFDSAG